MHTLIRGRSKAATFGLIRPRGRKRRPTPMTWRAGVRNRHASRLPSSVRLLLIVGAVCAAVFLLSELVWI